LKSVLLVIGACIIILLFSPILDAVNLFRMDDYAATYDVTTAANVTTAPVTLTEALFDDATAYVTVTSNLTADTALPASYVSSTKALTVSGLEASSTRRLSLSYKIDRLANYTGAGLGAKVLPLMLVLGVIGIVVAAAINANRRGD